MGDGDIYDADELFWVIRSVLLLCYYWIFVEYVEYIFDGVSVYMKCPRIRQEYFLHNVIKP